MTIKKGEIKESNFSCIDCHYFTFDKCKLNRHFNTMKHIRLTNPNKDEKKGEYHFECFNCGKQYKHQSSLCNHKKKCTPSKKNGEDKDYKELLLLALQENKEMREFMVKQHETIEKQHSTINEIIPKIGSTTNNINSNNSFNLNFFLNEQCKNAITMDEFMNKIEVSLSNLFYTREKGIAEGLSNIFIENMNKLPITERPIHCTDVKRETIYIKNEKWEKDEDQVQTKEAIKKLSNIQIKNLTKYKEEYPDCMKIDKQKDTYMEIIKATTDDLDDKEGKIIKNVCKNVYVKNDLIQK